MAKLQVRESVDVPRTRVDPDDEEGKRRLPVLRKIKGTEDETEPVMTKADAWHTVGTVLRTEDHLTYVELRAGGIALWNKHAAAGHWSQLTDGELVVQSNSITNSADLRLSDDE